MQLNIKKVCVLLLMVLTIVCAVAFPSVAASTALEDGMTIAFDAVSAPVGETVEVDVRLCDNPGFSYLRMTLVYDDALVLEDVRNGTIIADLDRGINLMWSADAQTQDTGVLVTLVFRIDPATAVGEYPVTVKVRECYNDMLDDVAVTVSDGVVVATCAHSNTERQAVKESSCTDSGLTEGVVCLDCDEVIVIQEVVPAKGHTMGEWIEIKAPTCTAVGSETRECENCDHFETREVVATGHNFGDWYETQASTESAQGEKRRDCEHCDAYETTPVAVLTHDHNRWEAVILNAVAPTCTTTGLTEGTKCSGCGEILVAQEEISATGHSYEATVTEFTCTDLGYTTYTCHCGDNYVDSYVEATGHTVSTWIVDLEPVPGVEGSRHKECEVCGEILEAEVIEALPDTEPDREPTTDAPEMSVSTEVGSETTDTADSDDRSSGCGSSVGFSGIITVAMIALAGVVIRKRED